LNNDTTVSFHHFMHEEIHEIELQSVLSGDIADGRKNS